MARQQSDPSIEDQSILIVGQDYIIDVQEVLKETATAAIVMTVARAHTVNCQWNSDDHAFLPLGIGSRYVLFLQKTIDRQGGFVGAFEPSRFRFAAQVAPESPLD